MNNAKKFDWKNLITNNILYVCLIAMIVVIAIISPSFLSWQVVSDILIQSTPKIVLAMGLLVVIIGGNNDMTVGRLAGLAAVIAGSLAQTSDYYLKFWPNLPEMPLWVMIVVPMIVGLLIGLLSGYVVSKMKVPSFLATLGMQMIIYGADLLFINKAPNNSQPLAGYLDVFNKFGTSGIGGFSYLMITSFIVLFVTYLILNKTTLGKNIFATGGNRDAAKVSGINVFKIDMFVFAYSGMLAGLAGAMLAARTGSANANYGAGFELDAIASCIIGGASFAGGIGTVPGAFLGVIVFSVINYGLTFIGLLSYWQYIVKGLIIIIAVALDMKKYASKG